MTLREYRELLTWSQADLARSAGLNNQTVSKAEAGDLIAAKSARAICEALSRALQRTITTKDIEGLNVRL